MPRCLRASALSIAWLLIISLNASAASAHSASFLGSFSDNSLVASTALPPQNDVNPYGVAVIPETQGALHRGNVLVSNFNNEENLQGTGTTIVEVSPSGQATTFADLASIPNSICPGGIGLTTALGLLPHGDVIVGSLPDQSGESKDAKAGCLLVLDSDGHLLRAISGPPINGPWDLTTVNFGNLADVFVTNVLNGTVAGGGDTVNEGTVVRLTLWFGQRQGRFGRFPGPFGNSNMPSVIAMREIGTGFAEKTDPAALVIGPTGVGLGRNGTLYVADTVENRIQAIPAALVRPNSAGVGTTVTEGGGLSSPLGLAIAPNGDILAANAGDGNMVETSPNGTQFPPTTLAESEGTLFGLAVAPYGQGLYYVNDGSNTLDLLH